MGNPPSLRITRSSGGTSSSSRRSTPPVTSRAVSLQSGFAHCIGSPFLNSRQAAPRERGSPYGMTEAIKVPIFSALNQGIRLVQKALHCGSSKNSDKIVKGIGGLAALCPSIWTRVRVSSICSEVCFLLVQVRSNSCQHRYRFPRGERLVCRRLKPDVMQQNWGENQAWDSHQSSSLE